MRGRRSAKFAEYISTYAILQGIGVHPTTLIEKRDGVVGVGVYVRDACDAGTTLLVVPSSRVCASSSLSNLGAAVALDTTPWTSRDASCSISSASHATATRTLGANARSGESQHTVRGSQDSHCASVHALAGSVDIRSSDTVAYPSDSVDSAHDSHASDLMGCLTQSASTLHWAVWCWRTALERHRTHSWLWGWLQSVPSPEEFAEVHARAAQLCRVHHVQLYPSYAHARARLAREVRSVYDHLSQVNLAPSYANFSWAADVLLSRSVLLPRCFGDALHSDRWRSPSQPDYANHSHPVLSSAPSRASAELSTEETPSEPHIELAVAPLIDLVNGPDNMDQSQRNIDACFCAHVHQHEQPRRRANTTLEVAFDASELPSWYVDWVRDEAAGYSSSCMNRGEGNSARKRYGSTTLESDCDAIVSDTYPTLLSDAATQRQQLWQQNSPFFLCLTLTCDVPASTELILPYTLPSLTTGRLGTVATTMSVVYQQIKMKLTTVSVNYMRQFCDGCNILIHVTLSPFRRITNRLSAEAPWLVTLLACTTVSIFPLLAYPYMKHYFFDDKRTKLEIERVRLCIQKGIDPYPFMHNKDLVLGNIGATLRKDSEMPEDMAWEHTLLHDYQKRKEELRREVGGNVDDTVEKLLRLREQHNAKMRSQTLDSIIKTTSDTTFAKRSPKRDETAV